MSQKRSKGKKGTTATAPATQERKAQERPPAYFLSLSVENVRCFGPKQVLDLSDGKGRPAQWTILLGDNGVGKTTLLQCLAGMEPVDVNQIFGLGGSLVYGARFLVDFPHTMLRSFSSKAIFGCSYYVDAKLRDSKRGREIAVEGVALGAASKALDPFRSLIDAGQFEVVCYAYGASRHTGKTSLSSSEGGRTLSLFRDDAPLINAEEWLVRADYAALKSGNGRSFAAKQRDHVKKLLIRLLPGANDIRITQKKEQRPTATVEFKTHYGWAPLEGLSLGYRAMIAWIVDLAARLFDRYPDSPDPLAEPALVLIDEIDLHLHPSWQRRIIRYLSRRFKNTQFIATAHSPLVVQGTEDANVVLLRRVGDHVVIDNNMQHVRGWRVDQILTSDLFGLPSARPPQYDKLLKQREKILAKPKLTKQDRDKLKELGGKLAAAPEGETPQDIEAMDIIRRAAAELKSQGRGAK